MNQLSFYLLSFAAALSFSCSTTSTSERPIDVDKTSPREIDSLIQEVGAEMGAAKSNDGPSIPLEINKEVENWLRYFTGKDKERFQRFISRGEFYRPMIEAKLVEQGAPKELYYLAMIESGFATHATSHASAVGIWQFIKPTGIRYGLAVTPYVDERRDPVRATLAAANYLRDLNRVFQSWFLAMAAYNAGESRIMGAIMRSGTRDFWELARKGALPKETMNYVPKFIAAAVIGHHPEKFGFTTARHDKIPELNELTVPAQVQLAGVAEKLSIPLDVIKRFNPHIRTNITPNHRADYKIWVPAEYYAQASSKTPALASLTRVNLRPAANTAKTTKVAYHVVRRGDTLTSIAKKYGVTVTFLKQRNGLRSNTLMAGKHLMLNPVKTQAVAKAKSTRSHRVRRGENLYVIAKKYGVDVDALKRINNLKRNSIYAGQILRVGY